MTLLQTWICPTGILQVSDRRLTNARTGKVVDDVFNKAVSWCARRTVGFTGIGYLGRNQKEPVSHFIAKTLADHLSFEAGIEALRVAATEEVARLPKAWDRRLSIHVAGLHDIYRTGVVRRISNFENPDNVAQFKDFVVGRGDVPFAPGNFGYLHSGVLTREEQKVMVDSLPRVYAMPNGLNRAARLMVQMQRRVADRVNTVGKDAMVVSIPAVNDGSGVIMTDPEGFNIAGNFPMFSFVREGGMSAETFGPDSACHGWATTEARAVTDGDNQSISVTMLKVPKPPEDRG
jgi:hypothetical protein